MVYIQIKKKLDEICNIEDEPISIQDLEQIIDKIENFSKTQLSNCKGLHYGKYIKRRKYQL